ncbi:peptidoglycan-binding domain-containing protein [Streptomyces sp. NPDC093801]|uniref:peptidoglycan-binding domain-containing protein n=1 Tax=Streptomyces sp. NPDC093801 TaxID=3155203 RepID=UPI00344D62B3
MDRDQREARGALHPDPDPAAELTSLLRQWWEAYPGVRPTQKALARRAGVDQATMSRYLNPRRPMAAPPRVVRVLHAELRADPVRLEEALALAEAVHAARRVPRARGAADEPGPGGAGAREEAVRAHRRVRVPLWVRVLGHLALLAAAVGAGAWLRPLPAGPSPLSSTAPSPASAPAAPPSAGPSWPVVRLGDVLWEARTVQHLLNAHGHPVAVTGTVDEATVTAVQGFQSARGLDPDGRVGPRTWPRLVVTVRAGDRGDAVTALQALLTNAGHPTAVTGSFTTDTEDVLRAFQTAHGMAATGIAEPPVWLAVMAAQQPRLHG